MDARVRNIIENSAKNTKPVWVKASWIMEVTGWEESKLRKARDQSIITHKRGSTGKWLYDLNSIPERLLLKK